MSVENIFDKESGMLTLTNAAMEAAFEIATSRAIENNLFDFKFYGYTVETSDAIDVVQNIHAHRTYH